MIESAARSIAGLAPAMSGLEQLSDELADIDRGALRGYFTPDEDERIRARFAQYLTARAGLLQTINDLQPLALGAETVGRGGATGISPGESEDATRLRAFVIAYTAVALLFRAATFIVERYAANSIIQRKLNEPEPRFGIPRKQYTAIYQSLTSPFNAWRIRDAVRFAEAHRDGIQGLRGDPLIEPLLDQLDQAEPSLRRRKREIFMHRMRYRWHSWRRRRASAFQQVMFSFLEMSGRVVADLHNPFHAKRVTPEIRDRLASLLRPGDVLVTRHDDAASNLFLPGYWIHAALHIGTDAERRELEIPLDDRCASRWAGSVRVLEAKKDGVLFRPLEETLAVDAVTVLRPRLERREIARAIGNAVKHEGKLYDFEFDFFRSDRLVCTGVVYRAYHGVGGIEFNLSRRAGRPTLSAEDLIAMAIARRCFEPVAVFGADGASGVVSEPQALDVLRRTSRG